MRRIVPAIHDPALAAVPHARIKENMKSVKI
jgi:hypothetical protein